MIKIQELKQGDIVRVVQDMTEREGTVVDVSREENMVYINNGIQEFWYTPEQIAAIPLTEKELFGLGFEKTETQNGKRSARCQHNPSPLSCVSATTRFPRADFRPR